MDANFLPASHSRQFVFIRGSKRTLDHFADIPFLDGGLFECLNREDPKNKNRMLRPDGFTTEGRRRDIPKRLFFADEIKGVESLKAHLGKSVAQAFISLNVNSVAQA